jgi:hypothetical protein
LPRLIRVVSEQVRAYAASNFIPELDRDDHPSKKLSAADLLNNAREHRGKIDWLWDEALASSRETISQWSSLIRKKALHAFEELRSEDALRWKILPSAEIKKTSYNTGSVLI